MILEAARDAADPVLYEPLLGFRDRANSEGMEDIVVEALDACAPPR